MDAQSSSTPSSSSSLQRGRACFNCRDRKIRCDGNKPVCGACVRSNRSDDCEYTDPEGRSRTQLLEKNIARLESRVRELEYPDDDASAVALHDPYALRRPASRMDRPASRMERPGSRMDRRPLQAIPGGRPASSASANSSSGSSSGRHHNPSSGPGSTQAIFENPDTWWNLDEPPLHIKQQLVDKFLPNASQFGFFLHVPLFRSSLVREYPPGHPYRPSSALLSTIYLWGLCLSQSDTFREREPTFLSRALQHTSNALSGSHPQQFLHTLQAEILLACYFFQNGRFLEGKHHSSSAASMVISCGLNKIRSSEYTSPTADFIGDRPPSLPRPRDTIDEGERINGFWAALVLDKCWSVALGSPSNFTDDEELGTRIDTPWPLDISGYEQGLLQPNVLSSSTVRDFTSDSLDLEEGGFSAPAIHAQAALLFERATDAATQWRPDMQPPEVASFRADFRVLDQLMEKYQNYLIPMDQFRGLSPHATRDLLVTHSLAYAATIQLHKSFTSRNANSNPKCLAAASAVVTILDNVDLSELVFINPIMGTVLMVVCQVFIDEISRLRSLRPSWSPEFPVGDEAQLIASTESVMGTMAKFAANCPVINFQFTKAQEAYAAI